MIAINALTQAAYQGGNQTKLLETEQKDQVWATYRQWQTLGLQVQKGQKGVKLFKIVTVENKRTEKKTKRVPRGFSVFNISQVAKIEEEA
jgi:antirestriction protein ArdC